jgi:hypothetical protein
VVVHTEPAAPPLPPGGVWGEARAASVDGSLTGASWMRWSAMTSATAGLRLSLASSAGETVAAVASITA